MMKFGKYQTGFEMGRSKFGWKRDFPENYLEFYLKTGREAASIAGDNMVHLEATINETIAETMFYRRDRPYYRIWPCILEAVPKTKLDIGCEVIVPRKHEVLSLELPYNNSSNGVTSVLVSIMPKSVRAALGPRFSSEGMIGYLTILCQFENKREETFLFESALKPGVTVEEQFSELPKYGTENMSDNAIKESLRLVVLVLGLMQTGSDYLTPDLIEKHRQWIGTDRESEYHEKAKKRGKNGWDVGRELQEQFDRAETSPHFRAPHFATVWTGKDRKIPKFVFRTGEGGGPIVVNRKKMIEVPTGYYGLEEEGDG